jgi:hypothetical protein
MMERVSNSSAVAIEAITAAFVKKIEYKACRWKGCTEKLNDGDYGWL